MNRMNKRKKKNKQQCYNETGEKDNKTITETATATILQQL